MKLYKFLLLGWLMLAPMSADAQLVFGNSVSSEEVTQEAGDTQFEYFSVTDDNMLWADDKTKFTKVQLKKNYLELESKEQGVFVSAVSKVSVDFKGNFLLMGAFAPLSVNDKHKFGFIFNARNESNFHAIVFDKKYAYYIIAEKGQISVEERALYKLSKNKAWSVTLVKEGNKCIVMHNNMEIMELKDLNFDGNKVGFYTDNKSKLYASGIGYFQQPEDDEN